MKTFTTAVFILIAVIAFSGKTFSQNYDFFEPKVTVGGYGELHYNYSKEESGKAKKILDFHRFVLFFGYAWTEKWSFKSELELEHNLVEEGQGELSLEQAYVNFHNADYLGFQAGVLLVSAGLINEYHEPPRFLGVERPDYAKYIIPTTWFGNGAGVYGIYRDFDYKIVVIEGLNSDKFTAGSGIRKGRQEGFKANAGTILFNGRLDFTGFPGLRAGASFTYNNAQGDTTSNKINLAEFHAQYKAHGVYSTFEFGNISYSSGNVSASRGFYAEIGYNVGKLFNVKSKIVPFVRYSDINTAAETISGGSSEMEHHYTKWMAGLSFLPIDQVVFKIDYSRQKRELGSVNTDLFNLGVGYWF